MKKCLSVVAVVFTLSLSLAPSAGAQPRVNPYLEVDKKIMAEIYTSSEPMDNLKELCDVHGSRFPGLPGDRGAVDYVMEKLKEYGCENVHAEEFTIDGWTRGPATLEIISPIKRSFDVISLPHSVGAEVEAKLVFLGAGAIEGYDTRKAEIEGNIVMVTSARPAGMTRSLHRTEKYRRSIMAGAKGWIFMNHYPAYGPPTGGISPVIPAIGIAYEDGAFLTRLIEREKEVVVRIKTTDKNHDVVTWNVVGDVVPDNPVDDEYIIVGSHLDGHDISQGAVDPASGAVTVMEIARNLSMVKHKLDQHRYDTLDMVEMQYLHLAAANYTRYLFRVANEENWNPRRKTTEEIDNFIKEQGYDQTVALTDQVKQYIRDNYKDMHPDTAEWLNRERVR